MQLRSLLRLFVKSSTVGLLSVALLQTGLAGDLPRTGSPVLSEADQHVATALKFELENDPEFRRLTLDLALRTDPGNAAARWQSGQVQVDGEWLPLVEAEARWKADERLATYREMRTKYGTSAQADLALARWCDRQRLTDQARFHWTRVYSSLPEAREEALRQLKLKPFHDGTQMLLATDDEIAEHSERIVRSVESYQRYLPLCLEIRKQFQSVSVRLREAALTRLKEIEDPLAIPAIEAALSAAGEPLTSHVLYHLQTMPEHEATMSLARHAVFAPAASTRELAARMLSEREVEDYAPWLLDQLVAPVRSEYWFERTPAGNLHYFHDFYREGANAEYVARRATSFVEGDIVAQVGAWTGKIRNVSFAPSHARRIITGNLYQVQYSAGNSDEVTRFVQEAAQKIEIERLIRHIQVEMTVAQREAETTLLNEQIAMRNASIVSVLEATTQERLGSKPAEWWKWWQKYNELYTPEVKPLRASYTQTGCRVPSLVRVEYVPSCFAAGTLVAAEDGLKPIESIQAGDRVLAQDPETGELAHKLVLGTTVRPPTDLLKLTVGEEEILATKGHPFWVVGAGWRMAKFIKAGDRIHSTSGAVVVDAIEDLEPALAYNLVVEDFHSYFVGKQRLLVHDNLLRKPTLAVVPGLKEKS